MNHPEIADNPHPAKKIWIWVGLAGALLLAAGVILIVFSLRNDFRVPDHILICLDPGHGGADPGAMWEGQTEKEDTLAIALAVREALEAYGFDDLTVMLTRENDQAVNLEQRAEAANQAGATLFISIHRNSGGGRGVETWISVQGERYETLLAKHIQEQLVQAEISRDRGVKRGTAGNPDSSYYVIANTQMPACLIELGFVDSEEDNRLLEEQFEAYAQAIARGILKMVKKL